MASPVREVPHVTTLPTPPCLSPAFQKWLACTDERLPASSTTHARRPLKRAYIDPNPSALVWAMVFDVDRPEPAIAWQDAPYGVPSAQLGHPEPPERSCASGLRAGLSGVQDTGKHGRPLNGSWLAFSTA
jgi:hypothetical protein